MTAFSRYIAGLAAVGVVAAGVASLASLSVRDEIATGVLAGFLVQAPLGWWTLSTIGTEKFQLVWLGGMVIRLVMIGFAALVLAAEFRFEAGALLLALVATLLLLLLVEAVTAVGEHSRAK